MALDVFISYSHKDRLLRDELATHLTNLRRQGLISDWFDGDIAPGAEWKEEILTHLNKARLILLLISADFMPPSSATALRCSRPSRATRRSRHGSSLSSCARPIGKARPSPISKRCRPMANPLLTGQPMIMPLPT